MTRGRNDYLAPCAEFDSVANEVSYDLPDSSWISNQLGRNIGAAINDEVKLLSFRLGP